MRICPDQSCPHRQRHGQPAQYRDDIETCRDCGHELVPAELGELEDRRSRESLPAISRDLWLRLAVTLAVPVLIELAARILLPGLDPYGVERLLRAEGATGTDHSSLGILAVGIVPVIVAHILVELAALVVPTWRRWRIGGPEGRARLQRGIVVTALVIGTVQACGVALWLDHASLRIPDLVAAPGLSFEAVATFTLVAGMVIVWFAALIIGRYGLGNGFSVLIAAGLVSDAGEQFARVLRFIREGTVAPGGLLVWVVGVGTALYFGWRCLTTRHHAIESPRDQPAHLRLPACGSSPLEGAMLLLLWPASMVRPFWADPAGPPLVELNSLLFLSLQVALIGGFVILFTILYNQPCRVARAWALFIDASKNEMAAQVKKMSRVAMRHSAKYLVLITLALAAMGRAGLGDAYWRAGVAVVVIAVWLDLTAEWRARRRLGPLVPVWPLHRVYLADVVLAALAKHGIEAHNRGIHHRTLLQFFGPFVPVEVMVAPEDEERARTALRVLAARDAG